MYPSICLFIALKKWYTKEGKEIIQTDAEFESFHALYIKYNDGIKK